MDLIEIMRDDANFKRAFVNVAASQTDANVISAVAGKKLRVVAMASQAGATATDLTFNSKPAGAGAAITMKFANGINAGKDMPLNVIGWFETNRGEGLTVTTGAGSATGIQLIYLEV